LPEFVLFAINNTILSTYKYIFENKDELVSNEEFKKEVAKNLASKSITSTPEL
jgi:hypothetical protein